MYVGAVIYTELGDENCMRQKDLFMFREIMQTLESSQHHLSIFEISKSVGVSAYSIKSTLFLLWGCNLVSYNPRLGWSVTSKDSIAYLTGLTRLESILKQAGLNFSISKNQSSVNDLAAATRTPDAVSGTGVLDEQSDSTK